jgi:hypothetical protein
MNLMTPISRPMEQLSHMADQTPMKSTPTAVSLFQTIKGVFPGSSNNRQISLDEISDTMEMHETHIHHGVYQLKGSVAIIFANSGSREMALDTKFAENLFHLDIQVGKRLLENRFDLPLKSNINSVMHKEASFLWFL